MSQKLDLEFVDRPIFSLAHLSILGFIILFMGIALTIFVVQTYQSANIELAQATFQLQQSETHASKMERLKNENVVEISEDELKKIRETVANLTTPWDALLSALEGIQTPDVALLNFEPNRKKQMVTLTGQAKNMQTMLQYVEAVSSLKMLSVAYLQNHVVDTNDPYKPVNFTIVAKWK